MGIDPITHAPRMDLLELASLLGSSLYNSSSCPLGMVPMVNPGLLTLTTGLMSSHCENPELQPQNFQGNQLRHPQVQNQFESFHGNNPQNLIQEVQPLNNPLLNESQIMQATAEHLSQNRFGFQNSLPDLWQVHGGNPSNDNSFSDPTFSFDSNSIGKFNMQNFSIDSVLPSLSSSSTPLNSSSMTYVNGSTEDEKDSYCSSSLMFDILSGLDTNAIL